MSMEDLTTAPPVKGRVTRRDWLRAARNTLVTEGVSQVKVLTLANQLEVARSSFYWFFESRGDLLDALLSEWELRNTSSIVDKCALPTVSIAEAAWNFFECFIDDTLFDQGLDFAVREWARRDAAVRAKIDLADAARLQAVEGLFLRHGYPPHVADARARILYFMQLGYHALEVREPMELRMSRLHEYLIGFTGETVDEETLAKFKARAFALRSEG
ncbi:MAG: TetR/AcrR family transcriptional regulator [Pseudomonadota bacterium]